MFFAYPTTEIYYLRLNYTRLKILFILEYKLIVKID